MLKMFLNIADEEILPWDAIQYMIGQINYGGRVTDDLDRICLMSILRKLIGEHIEEKAKLSQSGIYYIPAEGLASDYIRYIESLPNSEDPEVFGMHENASIVFNAQESSKMIETILNI
jgi:dynein heavy chain